MDSGTADPFSAGGPVAGVWASLSGSIGSVMGSILCIRWNFRATRVSGVTNRGTPIGGARGKSPASPAGAVLGGGVAGEAQGGDPSMGTAVERRRCLTEAISSSFSFCTPCQYLRLDVSGKSHYQ